MPDTHFVVERLNWRRVNGTFYRLPGEARVAAFDTFAEADGLRSAEEERARAVVNPFAGGLAVPFDQTHWQPDILCDYLADHGIAPPPLDKGKRDWSAWWDLEHPGWTPAQRRAAWEPLDKVRFYRVREAVRTPVAYAVVQVDWHYNDEWMYAGDEGGETQTVYRTRERAEAEAELLSEVVRRGLTERHEIGGRLPPTGDPFVKPKRQRRRFYEVVEVELGGLA